jgi:general secretion pathway protein M
MKENLKQFWQQRTHTERRTLTIGGALLAIALLYAFIWHPLTQEQQRLRAALPQLRAAAAQMQIQAAEVKRLRNLPQKSAQPNLRSALEYMSAHSAIGSPAISPMDADHARITFNAVAFDGWIEWVKTLQAEQGVRVESAEVFALAEPGMVKIQAVLSASGSHP